jgi:hypothetical protein
MVKHFSQPPATVAIPPGADESCELTGLDIRDKFLLDVWRGTFRISKLKLQNRVQSVVVLARLDVDGAPHTNPDGVRLSGTHVHLFREGFDDRWAHPVDPGRFTLLSDPGTTFQEFCAFCNIESPPPVQGVIV